MKKRLLVLSILIPLLSIASVFAGLAGGGIFSLVKNNTELDTSNALTQPVDITKYWDESDEIKALITAGKTENQWQGSGTKEDPYLISTALDLAWLSYRVYSGTGIFSTSVPNKYYYVDKYFKQTADIDVSNYWWQPIGSIRGRDGSSSSIGGYFSGKYDGNKHTVSGVFVDKLSGDAGKWKGLFGIIQGHSVDQYAEIKNVGVIDSIIKGVYYVGGIIGQVGKYVTISNCFNEGTIEASSEVGGVIGYTSETNNVIIENCYNNGDVNGGSTHIGGIIGKTYAPIRSCYNNGAINTEYALRKYVGGISGYGYDTYDCFNWGYVQGHNYVGGISGTGYGKIKNCYNYGRVYGTATGGIVGSIDGPLTITNCFNLGSTSFGISGSSGTIVNCYYGGSCTATQGVNSGTDNAVKLDDLDNLARNAEWYLDSSVWDSSSPWDFENIWNISPSILMGLPVFLYEYPYNYSGSGTEANPYIISKAKDLIAMSNNINSGVDNSAYFKQTADIRLSAAWTPIGLSTTDNSFRGNYDGGNFNIYGMYFANSNIENLGLFGAISGATIQNVHIRDSILVSSSNSRVYLGSIVGDGNGSGMAKIKNCSSDAKITDSSENGCVGGLAGSCSGYIENSTFSGTITSSAGLIGGIVASSGVSITNCVNNGDIEGTSSNCTVGGISASAMTITKCISTGNIKTNNIGASIVGTGSFLSITDCAGYGMIYSKDATKCGGIVGVGSGSITNCSFNGSSNLAIGMFYASSTTTKPTVTASYSQIGDRRNYTSGSYANYTVVANMNNDLPMQNNLYSIAIGGQTSDSVIDHLKSMGFSLLS